MMSKKLLWARALATCITVATATAGLAASSDITPFYGEYEGEVAATDDGKLVKRDLRVKISPHSKGFTVEWTAVTTKANGKVKRKDYTINFLPTRRKGIYRSGEARDMFGNAVPRDPLKGEPYVWARLHENTLTIFALHVLEDGGYEMQVYARTRVPDGLDLQYSRVRDGEVLRTVEAKLREVDRSPRGPTP